MQATKLWWILDEFDQNYDFLLISMKFHEIWWISHEFDENYDLLMTFIKFNEFSISLMKITIYYSDQWNSTQIRISWLGWMKIALFSWTLEWTHANACVYLALGPNKPNKQTNVLWCSGRSQLHRKGGAVSWWVLLHAGE